MGFVYVRRKSYRYGNHNTHLLIPSPGRFRLAFDTNRSCYENALSLFEKSIRPFYLYRRFSIKLKTRYKKNLKKRSESAGLYRNSVALRRREKQALLIDNPLITRDRGCLREFTHNC